MGGQSPTAGDSGDRSFIFDAGDEKAAAASARPSLDPTPWAPHGGRVSRGGGPIYNLSEVTFAIEGRTLLPPLSMELEGGRVHGLIGHNGSGKSTLLKLLARQQSATGGTVRFQGRPLDRWSNRGFARKVAYLPQEPAPALGMTARELVSLGRYPWHGALGRFTAIDREKVDEAMRLTDVVGFADRLVESLSGGERQRVWVAMLVAQDSECLLLDEPISSLDIAHQIEILSLVRKLSHRRDLSVIVVLHDVNMAARFCDDLIALHGGRLLARGPCAEMMKPAMLEAIYGVPMGIVPHPGTGIPISFAR
jgi:iron complex transport system ATP-binding protein